ncbi:UNVERIFIED_CONTAM: hypothetical protein RMT77_012785 [Armadillidium vulgare]
MLLNFMFVPHFGKISHNIGRLGFNHGLRRKYTQHIWKEKISKIIDLKGKISVIEDKQSWENVSSDISRDVAAVNAVGFDCEWASSNGKRKPVSLLQLATYSGNCYLFRLNSLQKNIPLTVQEILENRKILKVGVGCDVDASYFAEDYNVNVNGWLDLRHLAIDDGLKNRKLGLKSLANHYLGWTLHNNWKLRASDWESVTLTQQQVMYAAEDAIVGISILLAQLKNLWKPVLEESWETSMCKAIEEVCEPFVEVEFDQEKMKFCFVCGNKEVSVLKNVVPEEYIKYFPPIVELDSNRSLISLCNQCNERNSIKEEDLRRELAEEFDAPIEDSADAVETVAGKLQAVYAARILKVKENNLTEGQINFLQRILRKYYKTNTLTEDLINQATDMQKEIISEGCNLHSYKVFRYYEKVGLFHILTRWRQWFQDSMKPKYLPEYWQISSEQWWLQLRRKMHHYPLDSEVRGLYKLILVGRDGDIRAPYQPNTQARDNTCSSSKPKKEFGRENVLNLSSTGQSRDQT